MNLKARWGSLSFFWQVYWFTVLLVFVIVISVELVGENIFEPVFIYYFGDFTDIHETVLWFASIFMLSPLSGLFLSRFIEKKLSGLAESSVRLAGGDLSARTALAGSASDAFGKLVAHFNTMAQKLEDLFSMERRLLADVSHELRSPLTRMSMALALAEKSADTTTRRHLERIEKEIDTMGELVALLLEQGGHSLQSIEQGMVDVGELLRAVAADVSFEGKEAGKTAQCTVEAPLFVHGNALGLRTLFANIAGNALRYTPPGSTITMRADRHGKNILVTIRDQGPGVPEAMLDDIFRAFFRVDGSRDRNTGGVGLGLAIAKQIAHAHGGSISARNTLPGLELQVSLPALEQPCS